MANSQPNIWHAPMPLICSSFEPGHLDDVIEAMPDNDYRTIALAEAAYFRGNANEACRLAEPFLTSSILPLRISSCFICGFANLSLDHAHAARAVIGAVDRGAVEGGVRLLVGPGTRVVMRQ